MTDTEIIECIARAGALVARDGIDHWSTLPEASRNQHRKYAVMRLKAMRDFGLVVSMKPKRKARCAAADSTILSSSPA
jgi:hypothetical protein